jgi:hypothetical protein
VQECPFIDAGAVVEKDFDHHQVIVEHRLNTAKEYNIKEKIIYVVAGDPAPPHSQSLCDRKVSPSKIFHT